MNEKEFNKGIQDLKNISLSKTEKEAMLSHISTYADFHAPKAKVSKRHSFWAFMHMHSSIAYSALGFIFITSSTVYGAERALPGDILYPFKIYVNESIQSALITTSQAQARWESKRFVRRIEEAEILASKGRLDEATLLQVEARIDKHFEKFDKLSQNPKTKTPDAPQEPALMSAKSAPAPENARMTDENPTADVMMFAAFAVEDATTTPTEEREKDEFELEIEKHRAILQSIKGDDEKLNERIDRLDRKLSEKAQRRAENKLNLQVVTPHEQPNEPLLVEPVVEVKVEIEIENESDENVKDDVSRDGASVFEGVRENNRGKGKN